MTLNYIQNQQTAKITQVLSGPYTQISSSMMISRTRLRMLFILRFAGNVLLLQKKLPAADRAGQREIAYNRNNMGEHSPAEK